MRFTLKDIKGAVVEKKVNASYLNRLFQRLAQSDCGDNSCMFYGRGKGGMRTNGGCRCYQNLSYELMNDIDAQSSVPLEWDREGLLNEMVNAFKSNDQEINKALRENLKKCADAIRNAPINQILKVVKE